MHLIALDIRPLAASDAEAMSALGIASFERFVAPDWEPAACEVYARETTPAVLAGKLRNGAYALGAYIDAELVGFVLMPRPGLIQMFFVAPDRVRLGIGRALWEAVRAHLEGQCPEIRTVELNASPYALDFYRSLGFVPISAQFLQDGFRATRMACWLPARHMGVELIQRSPALQESR